MKLCLGVLSTRLGEATCLLLSPQFLQPMIAGRGAGMHLGALLKVYSGKIMGRFKIIALAAWAEWYSTPCLLFYSFCWIFYSISHLPGVFEWMVHEGQGCDPEAKTVRTPFWLAKHSFDMHCVALNSVQVWELLSSTLSPSCRITNEGQNDVP